MENIFNTRSIAEVSLTKFTTKNVAKFEIEQKTCNMKLQLFWESWKG